MSFVVIYSSNHRSLIQRVGKNVRVVSKGGEKKVGRHLGDKGRQGLGGKGQPATWWPGNIKGVLWGPEWALHGQGLQALGALERVTRVTVWWRLFFRKTTLRHRDGGMGDWGAGGGCKTYRNPGD